MTNYKRQSRFGGTGLQPQDELTQAGIDQGVENPLWTLANEGPKEIEPALALMLSDEQLLNTTKVYEVEIQIQGSVKFFRRDGANDEEFYVPSATLKFPVFGTSEAEVVDSEIVAKKVKALVDLLGEQSNLGERIYAENLGNLNKTKFFLDYRNLNGLYYRNQEELDSLPAQNKIFIQARYVPSTENITARPILELAN